MARLDAAKTRFYENASHELRSPLTVLGLAVEVLKPHLDTAGAAHLAAMSRALDRLNQLVDALLSFVNAGSHAFEPRFEEVDLAEATKAVVAMFPAIASQAGLSLDTEIDQVGNVEVDPEAWRSIVANLVSNAVKYTDDGGVTVRLKREEEDVHLEVSDTGMGIDDADQAHIFERFRRGVAGRSHDASGLGLGLSLVDDLVRAHDGTIEVHSHLGDGATFTVDLPLHRPEQAGSAPPVMSPVGVVGRPSSVEAGLLAPAQSTPKITPAMPR